jgi:uncharacterized protein
MAVTRRIFLKRTALTLGGLVAVDALGLEPRWLDVTRLDFSHLGLGKTLVHLTDLHYRGNRGWLDTILEVTRAEKPDLICFTGDLVDRRNPEYLAEAMDMLKQAGAPLYGVIGNHDPYDPASIRSFREAARDSGGCWLLDEAVDQGGFVIHGTNGIYGLQRSESKPKILLCHYPAVGDALETQPYDLILSGHSHGGQCRVPLLGPLILPSGVNGYAKGLYQTPAGKLFVGRGLGTTFLPLRVNCRPELTVVKL